MPITKYDWTTYVVGLDYPVKPPKPDMLKKIAEELTDEEIGQIPAARKHHEWEVSKYKTDSEEFIKRQNEVHRTFIEDLFEKCGAIRKNKRHEAAYSMAYERGQSSGYSEIAMEFEDLMHLLNIPEE